MDESSSKAEVSETLPADPAELWKGCMLALCVCAVRLPEYPFILNEHVWEGGLYLTTDHEGAKAALAFSEDNGVLVGLFQDFGSIRTELALSNQYAASFFKEAPNEQKELAEVLFSLFEEDMGHQKLPVVTTGFWSEENKIKSRDSFDDWYDNGGHLLETQLMPFEDAMAYYEEFYSIDQARLEIIERIYKERIQSPKRKVFLTAKEVETILERGPLNKSVCQAAFAGFQVYFEE